jgi:DNA-binding PadR family transcriptional regulator
MMLPLSPQRGGYIRPFGCTLFIRSFLLGHGPEGSPTIVPESGACQEDVFYYYKLALHKAYAEDAVAWENEQRIKNGRLIYTLEEYAERVAWFLSRIPYKFYKCRYHSFQRYFHRLKQLGWVEFTGKEEKSSIQEHYPDAPPRRYYRLTQKGIEAPDYQWSNPQLALYPERGLDYFREKRKERRYSRKAPTRRRTSTTDKR